MSHDISSAGFTLLGNDFFKVQEKLGATNFAIYAQVYSKTIGFHKFTQSISLGYLSQKTGLGIRTVQRGVKELEQKGVIEVQRNGRQRLRLTILGIVKTVDRGYQYLTSFLQKLGINLKNVKHRMAKLAIAIGQNGHTRMANLANIKEKNKVKEKEKGFFSIFSPSLLEKQKASGRQICQSIFSCIQKYGKDRSYQAWVKQNSSETVALTKGVLKEMNKSWFDLALSSEDSEAVITNTFGCRYAAWVKKKEL